MTRRFPRANEPSKALIYDGLSSQAPGLLFYQLIALITLIERNYMKLKILCLAIVTVALATTQPAPAAQQPLAQPEPAKAGPWKRWSWDTHAIFFGLSAAGIVDLFETREWLNSHALLDTTSQDEYGQMKIFCPPETLTARTADGTCNDLDNPAMGAAGIRFGRNVPIESTHPDLKNLMNPNPRLISYKLMTRKKLKEIPFLNLLAASWIQFMTHDWFSHDQNEALPPYYSVPATGLPGDPMGNAMMFLPRTHVDQTHTADGHPPTYLNENTHWFDGSQLYGSNLETQLKLRADSSTEAGMKACKFQIENDRLPLATDGVEQTGFKRNWWLGLSMLHNLFVLEHNSICDMLAKNNSQWTEQKRFDVARLINAAIIAKIHTVEWTPAILPNPLLGEGMHNNWTGSLDTSNEKVKKFSFTRFLGIVGNNKDLHGVPYTLTEEFISVYRMHSLLPENLHLVRMIKQNDSNDDRFVSIKDTRDQKSHEISDSYQMKDLFYSFGTSHPGALVLNNFPAFMQNIEVPLIGYTPFGKIDLAATDIIRDRERGVPRYNEFRRLVHLKPIARFEDLFDLKNLDLESTEQLKNLKEVYQDDVEKLDLVVGCLAEQFRPKAFGFGETQFQIFLVMAARRLQADRFFTTDYTPAVYTQAGLDYIDTASMKSVIERHYPELAPVLNRITPVGGIINAFNPWPAN